MARALKTFQAHLGFYDTVVAAPSQAAALKAWGSKQNLFALGLAKPAADQGAIAAALAKPGVVLRRPVGSKAAFSENPDLPKIPGGMKKRATARPAPPKPVAKAPKPAPAKPPKQAPDRSALDRAERALAEIERDEQSALAALAKRKAALVDEERQTKKDFRARRGQAESAVSSARNAHRQALLKR